MERYTVGKKVKNILERLDMSQEAFAKRADELGYPLSRQTLNAIINERNPLPSTIILHSIIQVCKNSNDPYLRNITYGYLLDDHIKEITITEYDKLKTNDFGKMSNKSVDILKMDTEVTNSIAPAVSFLIERSGFDLWLNINAYRYVDRLKEILLEYTKANLSVTYDFTLSSINKSLSQIRTSSDLSELSKYKYDSKKDNVINALEKIEELNESKVIYDVLHGNTDIDIIRKFLKNLKFIKKLRDKNIDIPKELIDEINYFIQILRENTDIYYDSLKYKIINRINAIL